MDRATHTHEAESSRAGRGLERTGKGGQDIDYTQGDARARSSPDPAQVGMKCKTLEPVLCAS